MLRSWVLFYCIPFSKSIKSQQGIAEGVSYAYCIPFSKSIKSQHPPVVYAGSLDCIPFSKSIKSQRRTARNSTYADCIPFSKSIKSQQHFDKYLPPCNCIPFSKSIKSQLRVDHRPRRDTVSHSQRASNHNPERGHPPRQGLYPILKEHQITTVSAALVSVAYCIPFSKSIKSQRALERTIRGRHCIPFSKSIKSQPAAVTSPLQATVSHSQRASNHN